MTIRTKAPFRVSFAGGGSDVSPYCWEHGGAVTSTTVDKYAYASVEPGGDEIVLHSIDFDSTGRFDVGRLAYTGDDFDLLKAVINQFELPGGFELTVHTDLPPESGMGGSASVAVAVIGALVQFAGRDLSQTEVANLAYYAEREDLGVKGGYQDQYAAAFGGLNHIRFKNKQTTVDPLDASPALRNELEYRSLLYYTGRQRESTKIHEDMEQQYKEKTTDEKTRRDQLKDVATRMSDALTDGDLSRFGELLHEGWEYKKRMSDKISDPWINEIYETARNNGALGGKILGAGGGGHILLFTDSSSIFDVQEALETYELEQVPFHFEQNGLQTWTTNQ